MTDQTLTPRAVPLALMPLVSQFALPYDPDRGLLITFNLRDEENQLWAICRAGENLDRDGRWRHEPLPSARSDEYKAATRFPLAEALEIARQAGLPVPERPADEREPLSPLEGDLARLRRLVRAGNANGELREALIALRDRGAKASDVCIHLERWRAVNDVTDRSEAIEESAMLALDMISGWAAAAAIDWPVR